MISNKDAVQSYIRTSGAHLKHPLEDNPARSFRNLGFDQASVRENSQSTTSKFSYETAGRQSNSIEKTKKPAPFILPPPPTNGFQVKKTKIKNGTVDKPSKKSIDQQQSLKDDLYSEQAEHLEESESLKESILEDNNGGETEESSSEETDPSSISREAQSLEESETEIEMLSALLDESSNAAEESSSVEESSSFEDSSSFQDVFEKEDQFEIEKMEDKSTVQKKNPLPIVKMPVLLAVLDIDVDIFDTISLSVPITNIIKIDWSAHSLESHVALPSNIVFLKGTLLADIEYVIDNENKIVKVEIPWKKAMNVTWLYPPEIPQKKWNEFSFMTHNWEEFSYHQESFDELAEEIYHNLRCTNFIWHEELGLRSVNSSIHVQGKGSLSIDLLQQQYIDLNK
ncbi:hypothetical protein ACUXCC_002264 [Cytobacillus horneckiae]|uniref:hypothetical protein n=1 Tax=Cytobacillus horneckiae TaxID=549687 RepID=UPI0019D1A214|nr:hypothetical protein [Cytobacillus horneckiae]MBN6887254.1 hypothetical protein [Cytobacillus horneckiae]